MTYAIGRGVRVDIGITEGAAKTLSALTAANPPVATSNAHGLSAKTLGYCQDMDGMEQLEGQSVRFSAVDTNTLTLEDLDTTDYNAFVAGEIVPITAWSTLVSSTGYNKAGGDSNPLELTVLLDDEQQFEAGMLAAETVTFTGRMETISGTAMAKIRSVARAGEFLVFRATLKDGSVRHFRGQPAIPSEQLDVGAVGSYSFTVQVKRRVCEGAA
jgi:hypothetical protein